MDAFNAAVTNNSNRTTAHACVTGVTWIAGGLALWFPADLRRLGIDVEIKVFPHANLGPQSAIGLSAGRHEPAIRAAEPEPEEPPNCFRLPVASDRVAKDRR